MKLQRIVVGIDFSPSSLSAARWVAQVLAPDAEVVLTHVLEAASDDDAERRLREVSDAVKAKHGRIEVRRGDAATTIANTADEGAADVIVIGAHRDDTGILNWLGNTAERVLGTARVPVIVAVNPGNERPRHILAAVDGSPISDAITAWSHLVAAQHMAQGCQLTVVGSPEPASVRATAVEASTMMAGVERGGPPAEGRDAWISGALGTPGGMNEHPEVVFGEPAQEILAAAARHGSGLIVMGRRGAGRARRALFGSVTKEVLRGTRCPVLVVMESPE